MNNKISEIIKQEGADILRSPNHIKTRFDIQHGVMSVRAHTISVAVNSLKIANMLGIKYDQRALVRGALLHDYFQYDWHDEEHAGIQNLHGLKHPGIALENAKKEFELSPRECEIIKKHMWPLTITPPLCREAWIVTMADKYCSLMETFNRKTKKGRIRIEKKRGRII